MLRSFRVANHKSIKDEQELVLVSAYDKARAVVPVTAIFGANASGKSNLLDALSWMQRSVRVSYGVWGPTAGVPRQAFRLDEHSRDDTSSFSIEIEAGGVYYIYGFAVDDQRVLQEWLYAYPKRRKRVLFDRDKDKWTFGASPLRAKLASARELTRDNALFLSTAAQSNIEDVMPVYLWLQDSLRIELPSTPGARPNVLDFGEVTRFLERSDKHRELVVSLIRAADLGITDVVAKKADASRADAELWFVHGPERVVMKTRDQSHGTLAWLRLLVAALNALERGSALCVDEIDSSVHPRLTARLIELFRGAESNPRGAQMIFTTHDATLLGTSFGQDVLFRDEVWFVEKDKQGATKVFPLTDFHPRREENTERRYLGGSYGAVPDVSEYEFRRVVAESFEAV